MFKMFLYKIQNIQLVQLTNGCYALRKGWILYSFADFDNVAHSGKWTWRREDWPWFNDCQALTKEDVLKCIEKYLTHKTYRVIPIEISHSSRVEIKECLESTLDN